MQGAMVGAAAGDVGSEIAGTTNQISLPLEEILFLLGHSIVAGVLLAFATFMISKKFNGKEALSNTGILLGASNIMFICVGLTGIMILANNNLVRAFAIVAAIALVRFRIKLSETNVNASLLFGIMSGMAFGLQELELGWSMVAVFFTLLGLVMLTVSASEFIDKRRGLLDKRAVRKLSKPQSMRHYYKRTPHLKVIQPATIPSENTAKSLDL